MKANTRSNTVKTTICKYESLFGDKHAFVTVTDWENGEGFDVTMNEKGCDSIFQMTLDQWTALKKTMKAHFKE